MFRPSPGPDYPQAKPRPSRILRTTPGPMTFQGAEFRFQAAPRPDCSFKKKKVWHPQPKQRHRSSSVPQGQDDSQAKPRQRSSSSQAQAQVILRPGPASPYCILRTEPNSVFKRRPGPIVVSKKAGLAWATSQVQARRGSSVLPWCSYE